MNLNSKFTENKSIIYIFFIGILISSFYSIYNINKFEKNEKNGHLMIRGDINLIWREAYAFKKDLIEKKNFFWQWNTLHKNFFTFKNYCFIFIFTRSKYL